MKKLHSILFAIAFCFGIFIQTTYAQVIVTATAGDVGPTAYTTVNAAFTAINAGTPQGDITITITGNTTEPATAVPLLMSATPSNYSSVLVTPSGGNWTINSAAAPTASRGVIELSGADNVTIDGDDPLTAGTRNLSIVVATNTSTGTAAVRFSSNSITGTDGADNCTLRNCIITGGRSSATSTTTSYGFVMSNSTGITTGAYSSLNTHIENNLITRAWYGIYCAGTSATYLNAGIQVLNNTIGSSTSALNIGSRGIFISYSASTAGVGSATISGNDISVGDYGISGYSNTIAGLEIGTVNAGCIVTKNNIHDINQPSTGGYGAHGIYITGAASNSGININNNFIRDCKMVVYQTSATSVYIPTGIFFTGGATLVRINYNTISMGTQLGSGANYSSFCIDASVSGVTIAEFQNNILKNTHSSTSAYGLYCVATSNISGGAINYNDLYCPNANVGYYTTLQTNLASWQTATGKDANSISADPGFVSATDLHINVGSTVVNNLGTPVTGITTDIDGDIRNAVTPDIGADEYTPIVCAGANGGIISPASVDACIGLTYAMSTTGSEIGAGVSYQWEVSTVGGGVGFANVTGGNGATSTTDTTGTLSTGIYYYRLRVDCSNGPVTGYSNELTLTVHALPNVAVTPVTGNYCTPGGTAVMMTASGATTYTWNPATGLDVSTGAIVNASPAITTLYTVNGTDANGCINTASATINVGASVTTTATATPSTICTGENSQLLVTASQNYDNHVSAYAFTYSSTAYTPLSGGITSTATGDDGTQTSIPIGFNFTYNGNLFTTFGVSTNGTIQLGTTATSYSNSLATNANVIAPMWDDNNLSAGTITYLTSGSAPNRVLTVDWYNVSIGGGGLTSGSTNQYQLQLFESSNVIQFNYAALNTTNALSASIGISGLVGNFLSVTPGVPPTASNLIENSTISSVTDIPSGTSYIFTPPAGPVFIYAWTPSSFISGQETIADPLATAVTTTTNYTVTVTGNSGCFSTANANVTVSSSIAITTQPLPDTRCEGETTTFTIVATGPNLIYEWRKGGIAIDNIANPSAATATLTLTNVSTADAANYDCIVSASCGSPVTSDAVALIVNPNPTASASASSPVCNGLNLTLTGNTNIGTTFSWTGPNSFTSTDQNPVIIGVTSAANGVYYFTATTNGCSTSASTAFVTVNPTPSAIAITPNSATICAGTIQQLTATGGAVSGISILNENFNSGAPGWTTTNTSTGGSFALAAWTIQNDSYYYGGYTFNSNDNTQFYMSNSDVQGSGGTTNTILESPTVNTTGFTTLNLAFYHYFKYYSTPTNDSAVVEVSTDGAIWERVIKYSGADVGASDAFVAANINLNAFVNQPTLHIRFHYTTAYGYYWAIDNVSLSGDQTAAMTWSPLTELYTDAGATTAYAGTAAETVYARPNTAITYTVTASSIAGCTSTADVTINMTTSAAIITQPVPVVKCAGETATFDVVANGLGFTYEWRKDGITIDNIANPSAATSTLTLANVASGDAANYDCIITAGCGSPVTSDAVSLTVNPLPAVVVTPNAASICNPGGTPIDLSASGADTYSWSPSDGLSATTGANVTANPAGTTIYTVTGAYTATGCINTAAATISVGNTPSVPVITPASPTLCLGSVQQLDASGGAPSPTILNENFDSPTNSWTTINNSTGGTDPALTAWTLQPDGFIYSSVTYHSNDNSQFYFSNSDIAGSGVTTATILQSPSFSTVGYTSANLSFYHYFRYISLSAKVDYSTDGTNWTTMQSFTATIGTPTAFVNENITLPAGALNQPVVYIRYKYDAGWDWYWAIDNVVITGTAAPVDYAWSPITDLYTDAGATTAYTGTASSTVYAKPLANQTYTLTASTAIGCSSTADVTITIGTILPVNLGNDSTLCSDQSITLNAGTGYSSYLWSNGATTQTTTIDTNGIGIGTFTYYVTVTLGACTDVDTIHVTFASCTAIIENNAEVSVNVFPNPTDGKTNVVVHGFNSDADLSIFNTEGQAVYYERISGRSTTQLNLSNLSAGVYMLKISNNNQSSLVRLVLQK